MLRVASVGLGRLPCNCGHSATRARKVAPLAFGGVVFGGMAEAATAQALARLAGSAA